MDCRPPGSSVHGISQTRILKWVAISFSRGSSWPRVQTYVSCIGRWVLYHWASKESSPNHSKSRGYLIVPTYCCAFCKFGQMYNNIYSSLWYLTEYFQYPKNPAFHLFIPSPTPAPGNINSSVSIVLPFTGCHMIEHTVCTISNWLLYLSNTHLCFFHVFSSLDSSFICVCVCILCMCSVMFNSLWPPWIIACQASLHGIFQARMLEQVAISYSRASSHPRDQTCIFCIGRQILLPPSHLGSSLIFSTEYYSIIWMWHNLFIHPSTEEYLGCFQVLELWTKLL